jgi:hypothetical protein
MNHLLHTRIQASLAIFHARFSLLLPDFILANDPQAILDVELQLHVLTRLLADHLFGSLLDHILTHPDFQAPVCAAAKAHHPWLRAGGVRTHRIRLLGGTIVSFKVPYLKTDRRGPRPGRKRGIGRRGKGGTGLYPTLAALGIWSGATPALTDEVVTQFSALDSHRAALDTLARRGIDLDPKVARRIFNRFAQRACQQRHKWLETARNGPSQSSGPLAGKRVVVTLDGGRCRIRIPARGGRRRAKTRHRGYKAPWKEPKLLVIYVIGPDGKAVDEYRPVIDGTMGDCNAVFEMLIGYLKALGCAQAGTLVVVGDGARWIWERVGQLVSQVGIERERVIEVLDFWHALEVLHRVSEVPRWKARTKRRWMSKAKKLLKGGQIDELVKHIKTLAVGRRSKAIREHVGYFAGNAHRMRYDRYRRLKVPQGSGAVESAVRRVINLRLKGCGKFWLRDSAQGMLLVRSYLKSGRLGDLVCWSLSTAAPWWNDPGPGPVFTLLKADYDAIEPSFKFAA